MVFGYGIGSKNRLFNNLVLGKALNSLSRFGKGKKIFEIWGKMKTTGALEEKTHPLLFPESERARKNDLDATLRLVTCETLPCASPVGQIA